MKKSSDFRHQSYPPQTTPSLDNIMDSEITSLGSFWSDYPSPAEYDNFPTPYYCQDEPNHVVRNPKSLKFTHALPYMLHGHKHVSPSSPMREDRGKDFLQFSALDPSPSYISSLAAENYNDCDVDGIDESPSNPFHLHSSIPVHAPPSSYSHLQCSKKAISNLRLSLNIKASLYSSYFPSGHDLNPHFIHCYQLGDELGSGGYGFVMTARHRTAGHEVAVKFIIKKKVPEYAWVEDESFGKLPTEVFLLSCIDNEYIVKCLDFFEDSLYFYLVQELHGSPWTKYRRSREPSPLTSISSMSYALPTPGLSPSASTISLSSYRADSNSSSPHTPSDRCCSLDGHCVYKNSPNTPTASAAYPREYFRRPSYDLFECIEQCKDKRLSERQARYVFSQIVEAVHYLDSNGIAHRDIKDENIVIGRDLKVKLIDFGSASIVDPNEPRPYYTLFYGTTAYASPEILLKKQYQAAPAEIWTLGVLLSFLLTGTSPFPTVKDAIRGSIILAKSHDVHLSRSAMSLMRRCLDPNPQTRATIKEIQAHRWLR